MEAITRLNNNKVMPTPIPLSVYPQHRHIPRNRSSNVAPVMTIAICFFYPLPQQTHNKSTKTHSQKGISAGKLFIVSTLNFLLSSPTTHKYTLCPHRQLTPSTTLYIIFPLYFPSKPTILFPTTTPVEHKIVSNPPAFFLTVGPFFQTRN